MRIQSEDFRLPLACEGSTLSYFLSMCNHQPIPACEDWSHSPVQTRERRIAGPVFVVGCPRSGTSIIGSCLAAHSRLSGGNESLFLLEMSRIFFGLHQGVNRRNLRALEPLLSADDLLLAIAHFADQIFGQSTGAQGHKRYVDHTPWYVGLMPFIHMLYRDASFVHVLRDGRDVTLSLAQSHSRGFAWAGRSIEERALLWRSLVVLGRECGADLGRDRYMEVFYEDLCECPAKTLAGVLKWLGHDWEEGVLDPLATPVANPARVNAVLGHRDSSGSLVITPKVVGNSWPTDWSDEERRLFDAAAGDLLDRLGYSRAG